MIGDRKKLIELREETGIDYLDIQAVTGALKISREVLDINKKEFEKSKYIIKQLQRYPEDSSGDLIKKESKMDTELKNYNEVKSDLKKEKGRVKLLTRQLKKLTK